MKTLKTLVAIALSAAGLGSAVTLGVVANNDTNKVQQAEAAAVAEGKITVDLTKNWANAAIKLSIYFYDDNSHNGWGSLVSVAKNQNEAEVSYSLNFTPTKMIAVRYDPVATTTGWSNVWNQAPSSGGYNFGHHFRITDWSTAVVDEYAAVKGSGNGWSGDRAVLSNVKLNDSNYCEYYSDSVQLNAGEEFKVVYANEWYGTFEASIYVKDIFSGGGSDNIVCSTAGTYALYFDASTHKTYINNPAYAKADDWGQTFLNGMVCDGEGSITNDDWSSLSSSYAALDSSVKAIFTAVEYMDEEVEPSTYYEKAVQRYDYIVKKYGTTAKPDFMGRIQAGKLVASASNSMSNVKMNASVTPFVIIASIITLSAAGAFFLIRKKRKEQ